MRVNSSFSVPCGNSEGGAGWILDQPDHICTCSRNYSKVIFSKQHSSFAPELTPVSQTFKDFFPLLFYWGFICFKYLNTWTEMDWNFGRSISLGEENRSDPSPVPLSPRTPCAELTSLSSGHSIRMTCKQRISKEPGLCTIWGQEVLISELPI